jgi:lipopolysaccharide export system ATP-binding protein
VVNHVSVSVKQGEIVGLLGPNGAGKTTSFYMVVGLIKPDVGDVFLNDINITKLPMYKRAQMGIGYLPQEASVFRKLTVENNIMAVLEMTKMSKAERKHKLEELLDEFHLHHVRKNNGDSLSGGERRRTEIARALAVDPKFILLDEPFAGVDPIAVEDIQSVVARLKYKNIGILITDHNVNETLSICDRAYLLIDGKIFQHGTAEELAENEQVRRLYLGTNFELKRKDWIIEMGMKDSNKQFSLSSFKESLNRIIEKANDILQSGIGELDNQFDIKPRLIKLEDLKVDEFVTEYNDLKDGLRNSLLTTTEVDVKKLINRLPEITENDFHSSWFFVVEDIVLGTDLNSIADYFKYEDTKATLHQLASHLGQLKLRFEAISNSK